MKFIASFAAAVAALSVAGSAAAASPLAGYYVQGSVGGDFQANRDNGTAVSVAVGKDFGVLRGEVEYLGARGNDSKKLGGTAADLLNANVYVDSPKAILGLTPFVGVGVGYGSLFRSGIVGGSDQGVVFNGTVGATYPLSAKLQLVTEYRGFLANSIEFKKSSKSAENFAAGAATVGLRYTF